MPVAPGDGGCPDEAGLSGFVEGTLAMEERERLEAHLRACPACFEVVALLQASGTLTAPAAFSPGAPRPTTPLTRGTLVSRYVLLERVGAGGMGVVYAAYDPELERKVALKLLHPSLLHPSAPGGAMEGLAQARLLREAKALARLSDPHVVPVFDAGTFEGRVFLAMEWVDGGTLARWLEERPRSWREALEVLRRAGSGLAAAHAAGIVHRDFKPDNLLMGRDGRVRVTDFGLARAVESSALAADPHEASPDAGGATLATVPGQPALTRTGARLGTPAYMAPEQLDGLPVDARADQFSFCVTLYEALWGERPFAGGTLEELRAAIASGQVRPPTGASVPTWVRRVVLRGLKAQPSERHPSMEALLTALARPPGQARRRMGLGALALLAALVAVTVPLGRAHVAREQACTTAARALEHVWDAAAHERMQEAFTRTGVPYARSAFTLSQDALDAYAASWSQARRRACEQSQEDAPLAREREECLEGAARHFTALAELLAGADETVVQHAARASRSLPDLAACQDARVLARSEAQAPADPEARERWSALRGRLAAVRARYEAGRFDEGLTQALAAREEARTGGFVRAEAEALLLAGRLQEKQGRFTEAEVALHDAALTAEQARDEQGIAWARAALIGVVGVRQSRTEEGERLARYAQVALARAGSPSELDRYLHNILGMLRYQQGRFDEAEAQWREALALFERAGQAERHEAGMIWSNLGTVLVEAGRYEEAATCLQRALGIVQRQLGPEHPELAVVMTNLAMAWGRMGRDQESYAMSEQVLALVRRVRPPDHHDVLLAMQNMASAYVDVRRLEDAWALYAQAAAGAERSRGPRAAQVGTIRLSWAEALLQHGSPREALEQFRRCHDICRAALGEQHVRTLLCLSGLGQAHLKLGEPRRAVPLLEQALARFEPEASEPDDVAVTHFALARALHAEPGQRARARAEAHTARALFTEAKHPEAAAEVDRWLARPDAP